MDGEQDSSELGLLGRYGVVVIPAPPHGDGAWLVTLAWWDGDAFVSQAEGPMFDTRAEAQDEAARLVDWVAERQDQDDLLRAWEVMRRQVADDAMPKRGPLSQLPFLR